MCILGSKESSGFNSIDINPSYRHSFSFVSPFLLDYLPHFLLIYLIFPSVVDAGLGFSFTVSAGLRSCLRGVPT
jgi:hypothetical protein